MSNWKKLVVSGSQAHLASVTASNGVVITGSLVTTGSNTLDANTDDFADVSGLPDSCKDVVVLGAAYKLLSYLDAG